MEMVLPEHLRLAATNDPSLRAWTTTIPATIAHVQTLWSLSVGAPFEPGGVTAWVAPAHTATGTSSVVKIGHRHVEAAHEADALRLWNGMGAVRLLDRYEDDDTIVLHLERCVPGTPLAERDELEQDRVIAVLLGRLWRDPPANHPFRTLEEMCGRWADDFEARETHRLIDIDPGLGACPSNHSASSGQLRISRRPPSHRPKQGAFDVTSLREFEPWLGIRFSKRYWDTLLVRLGVGLLRELPRTATSSVILTTDLHARNVLSAGRDPWLAIDPKPHVGDPAYDVTQHMINCPTRLNSDPMRFCQRMAELASVEASRVHQWMFARAVQMVPTWPAFSSVAAELAP